MSWFFSLLAIFLYFIRDKSSERLAIKDLKNLRNEPKRNNNELIEQYELIDNLKANIGKTALIKTKNLTHLYQNQINDRNFEFKAKILEVDDEWIKLELSTNRYLNVRTSDFLYFRVELIIDFFVTEEFERIDRNV